jgi:hypothetical protein
MTDSESDFQINRLHTQNSHTLNAQKVEGFSGDEIARAMVKNDEKVQASHLSGNQFPPRVLARNSEQQSNANADEAKNRRERTRRQNTRQILKKHIELYVCHHKPKAFFA